MVYRKRESKSRKYKKTHSHEQSVHKEEQAPKEEKLVPAPVAANEAEERKKSQPFGFLSSIFGGEKIERSGNPLFHILDYDIYLDDLLLAGLIILLLTDKVEDELLLIVLVYLLLDIF